MKEPGSGLVSRYPFPMIFATARLIIRDYRDADRAVLFAISADLRTRRFHTRAVSRADTDAFIDKQIATLRDIGYGYAVVERKSDGAVVGDVGMRPMGDDMPFSEDVQYDIGWQLDPRYFGQGYAGEAAIEQHPSVRIAFSNLTDGCCSIFLICRSIPEGIETYRFNPFGY